MTKYEALRILGLNNSATKIEIKKAYRNLAKKYHPDNFIEGSLAQKKAIEKMQQINNARDIIEGKNKNYGYYRSNTNAEIDINEYKEKIIKSLNRLKKKGNISSEFEHYYDEIDSIITNYRSSIIGLYTIFMVEKKYYECLDLIKNIYKKITYDFFKINEIDKNDIKEKINYDCSFEDFYNQLLSINKKYNKKEKYRKKLRNDLRDYELRVGYNALKKIIALLIEKELDTLKKINYINYQQSLDSIKRKIDILFEQYFNSLSDINYLLKFLDNSNTANLESIKLKNLALTLYEKLQYQIDLSTLNEAEELNIIVKNLKKINNNNKTFEAYIKTIVCNFEASLKNFCYPKDLLKIQFAQKIFNEIFDVIEKTKLGIIDLDNFSKLTNLKFKNYEEDITILNEINGLDNSKQIYILNIDSEKSDNITIGMVNQKNDDYISIEGFISTSQGLSLSKDTMEKKKFKQMYIPLYDYLKMCNFSGKNYLFDNNIIILYYSNFITFGYDEKNGSILFFWNQKNIEGQNDCSSKIEIFKDRAYTIEKISETLQNYLIRNKNVKNGKIY